MSDWRSMRPAQVMYLCGLMSGGAGLACGADNRSADEPVRSITAAATLPVGVTVSSDLLHPFWVADAAAPSSIAFVDPTYVAAFRDSWSNGIYVTRFADDGIPLDFPAVPIVVGGAPSAPIIRAVGDDAVVVWADTATMYGARVASDGQPLGDFPVVLGSDVAGTFDLVADEAGDALIVWRRSSDKAIVAVPWKANGLVEPPVVVDPSAACVAWSGAVLAPSISYGAGSFLMTWMDADAETQKCALVARRVTSAAEPLESEPFVVAEPRTSWDTLPQSSAFNGENHVIVWPFIRRAAGDNRVELYSIRVGVDGVVVDPNGELLAARTMDYWREPTPTIVPQAASDLVVWNEAEIHGKEISKTDGTLVIPRRVVLTSSWERPNAATNGSDTLIMSGNRVTSWSVSASGPAEGTAFVAKVADVGGGSGTGSPTTTVRGPDGYRVQWKGRTGPVAALLRQDGSDGEYAYPLDPEPIASDGVGYLGARFETQNYDYDIGPYSLLARRFSSAGVPLDSVPIEVDVDRSSTMDPTLNGAAFSNGTYLVLRQTTYEKYLSAGSAWEFGHDGHGVLISDQGVPIATYEFPAEDEDHIQLAVVPSASGFTVGWISRVWYRCSQEDRYPICDDPNVPNTDAFGPVFIRLQRVWADGSREPYVEFDGSGSWELGWAPTFTMATDGQSVLAVGLRGTDIWAQLFDEDLEKRSDPFIVASGRPYYQAVKATFTGSHYLVAWSDERNETSSGLDIYAARVLPDGESLDPLGFAVVDEPGDDLLVSAESYGDDHALLTYGGARAVMISFDGAGAPCSDNSDCASGHCVDDVCCDSACGGGDPSDCQVCSVAAGGGADGVCQSLPADTVCRPGISDCDGPELCDGDSLVCPVDDPTARNGATCDDENALTDDDICVDGVCVGEPSNTAGAAGWSGTEGDVGGATTTSTGGDGTGGAGTGGVGTGGVGTGGVGTGGVGTGGAGTGGVGTGGVGTGGVAGSGGAGTGGVGTGGDGTGGGAGVGGTGTGGVGTGGDGTGGGAGVGGTGTGGLGTGGAGTGGLGTGGTGGVGTGGVGTGGVGTGGVGTGGVGTGGAGTGGDGTGTGGAGVGGTGTGGVGTGGDGTGTGGAGVGGTGTGGLGTGGAGTGGSGTGGAGGAGGATTGTGGVAGTGGAGTGGATTATGGSGIGGTTTDGDSTGSGGHAGGGGPSCGCSVPTGARGSWWALLALGAAVGRRKRRPKGE